MKKSSFTYILIILLFFNNILCFNNINQIFTSSTSSHSFAISNYNNKTYAWGYNSNFQLGVGSFTQNLNTPQEIYSNNNINKKIILIGTGGLHTMVLCNDGNLYSWGSMFMDNLVMVL
jgi:alpha-tubulin suppressor-like RCC1 family protein